MTDSDQMIAELRKVSEYLRELASYNRRHELAEALQDPERRLAYERSDGARNSEEVSAAEEITKTGRTVLNWWKEWEQKGLVDTSGKHPKARYDTFVLRTQDEG